MKSLFPETTCLGSEALNIIGRRLFPKQWTGKELDARRLPEPQKAEAAQREASKCSEASELLHSLLGFYVPLDEVLAWPNPNSDKYVIERDAHRRWRAAARALDAAFRYGHISFWVVTDTGDRIDIPAHWRERPPRISIGALLDAWTREQTKMDVNSAREIKRSRLFGDHRDKKIAGTLYVDRSELVSALNSYGVTGANEQVDSGEQVDTGEPTVTKKTETRQRDEKIHDLFKAISADNPKAKQGRIFDMMRVKQADLFTNRRETVRVKEISNQRIARIIREQKG